MDDDRYSLLRDITAFVVVMLACPVAVFAGSAAGCIGSGGFEAECALNGVYIAPVMLGIAGVAAGVVTRGWTGLLIVLVATVVGMFSILLLSFAVGRPVPVDPVSGVIATVWFSGPIVIGYGIGRLAMHLYSGRASRQDGGSSAEGPADTQGDAPGGNPA